MTHGWGTKPLQIQNTHDRIINLRYAPGLLRLTKNPLQLRRLGAASLRVDRALEALFPSTQAAHLSATHIDTPHTTRLRRTELPPQYPLHSSSAARPPYRFLMSLPVEHFAPWDLQAFYTRQTPAALPCRPHAYIRSYPFLPPAGDALSTHARRRSGEANVLLLCTHHEVHIYLLISASGARLPPPFQL